MTSSLGESGGDGGGTRTASITMPLHVLRQHVLGMLVPSDPYPFLSVVEDYLAAVPVDDQIRASAVRLLTQKGLPSVAAELARACPARSSNASEMRRAAQQLALSQQDQVAWEETEPQFADNLRSLRGRGEPGEVLARAVERTWREECGDLSLHRANDGNYQVRAKRSDGRPIWVPAALDYVNGQERLQATKEWEGKLVGSFLVDGVGMGWLIGRLHSATQHKFLNYSPALYLVEPNLRALAVVLHLHDWTEILTDERVYLFAGPSAWSQWKDLMLEHSMLMTPPRMVRLTPWPGMPASPGVAVRQEVVQHRKEVSAGYTRRLSGRYASRDAAFWTHRFQTVGNHDPLRVLLITCRYTTFLQHATRDMMAAFERAGMATRLLMEEHDHAVLSREVYLNVMAEFEPDLVFVVDHHRHENADCCPPGIPYVCWIQDEMPSLFEPEVGRRLGPLDFTIGFGRTRCVLQCHYPADQFMPCRMAVDPAKFRTNGEAPFVIPAQAGIQIPKFRANGDTAFVIPAQAGIQIPNVRANGDTADPGPPPHCDVAYVSHHSEPPDAMHDRLRKEATDDRLRQLMDVFYEANQPLFASERFNGGYDLDGLFRKTEADTGMDCGDAQMRERVMSVYVRPLADRILRHTTLTWVADWADATGHTLHLYGRGWDRHARFAPYARGEAQHGRHLARIARNAAINLHTGTCSGLHQRVLETAIAGGFLLVRYNPFDFHPAAHESLRRYLIEHEIHEPTSIPIAQLPADYVEARRQRIQQTGRTMSDQVEITREYLLEQDPRRQDDRRLDYAGLAFPDFERITFTDPATFAQQAQHYLAHAEDRQAIVARMQQAVNELFTYDALVARLMAFLRDRLRAAVV